MHFFWYEQKSLYCAIYAAVDAVYHLVVLLL